jgi:hypothetical protein
MDRFGCMYSYPSPQMHVIPDYPPLPRGRPMLLKYSQRYIVLRFNLLAALVGPVMLCYAILEFEPRSIAAYVKSTTYIYSSLEAQTEYARSRRPQE